MVVDGIDRKFICSSIMQEKEREKKIIFDHATACARSCTLRA